MDEVVTCRVRRRRTSNSLFVVVIADTRTWMRPNGEHLPRGTFLLPGLRRLDHVAARQLLPHPEMRPRTPQRRPLVQAQVSIQIASGNWAVVQHSRLLHNRHSPVPGPTLSVFILIV